MALDFRFARNMPIAELRERSQAAWAAAAEEVIAPLRRPIPFSDANTNDKATVHLMVVVHGRGNNCKIVSTDGSPANLRRAPLVSPSKGWPIAKLYHSQVDWSADEPGHLGFEIIMLSGWWAKKLEFAQARSPELNVAIEWSQEHLDAWASMKRKWAITQRGPYERKPLLNRGQVQ
jgi:hypothetical protein